MSAGLLLLLIALAFVPVVKCLSVVLRHCFCPCRFKLAREGYIELPRNWHVYGTWCGTCSCGRRYLYRSEFGLLEDLND